jgi:hypothetical protein
MQPMLSGHQLMELAQRPGPWVTICMPLNGGGPLAKQDPIRYRNLVRRAADELEKRSTELERREPLLEKLRTLAERGDLFNAGARGLCVFANDDELTYSFLPIEIEEDARVDARPYLEPLIPIVTDPVHFYIIALSLHDVRLIECNRFVARELPLPDGTPTRVEDAAGWEVGQDSLQYHDIKPNQARPAGNAGNRPIYHGQGAGTDDWRIDAEKFVRAIDAALYRTATHKGSPVVLFASEKLEQVMRDVSSLPNLVSPALHGNVEHASVEDLHERALPLVLPRFEERIGAAKERLMNLLGTGNATSQIEQVVIAAADGRIDTLFVRQGAHLVGSFDPDTHSVRLGNGRASAGDLIDRAATDTFLTGGVVYRLSAEEMPVDNEVAAILRY